MIDNPVMARRRAGFGILIALVVILMVCLLVAGVAQLFFSGQVYSQAARGAGGMAAEYLAESALEDVLHQLNLDLNDPARPVFREVRRALLTREPGELDLSGRYKLTHLTESLEASDDAGFHGLFDLRAPRLKLRVVPRTQGDEPQLLEMEATASLRVGRRSITRTVRVHRQVGITLVAPHRPLDQLPFAIVQTPFLEDFRRVVEEVTISVQAYNRTGELLERWKSAVEGKPPGVSMVATLPPLSVGPEPATEAMALLLLADEQYVYRGLWDELEEAEILKLMPPEGSVIFARAKEEVDLPAFQYYARLKKLEPMLEKLRTARGKLKPVMKPLEDAVTRGSLPSATHAQWSGQMGDLGRELLDTLKPLQEGVLEITKHLNRHTARGFTANKVLRDKHWQSELPIWPLAQHVNGGQAFSDLIEEWPAVSGHLAIYPGPTRTDDRPPPGALCTVTMERWRGQAIVSSEEGDLAVGRLTLDRPGDRLVVQADTIQVTGAPIQAALVSRKGLVTEVDANIEGSLIIEIYPRPEPGADEKPWRGRVRYDPRLAAGSIGRGNDLSGVALDRYVVSVSPRISHKEVSWQ